VNSLIDRRGKKEDGRAPLFLPVPLPYNKKKKEKKKKKKKNGQFRNAIRANVPNYLSKTKKKGGKSGDARFEWSGRKKGEKLSCFCVYSDRERKKDRRDGRPGPRLSVRGREKKKKKSDSGIEVRVEKTWASSCIVR